jgi:hydrogenase maturation protease
MKRNNLAIIGIGNEIMGDDGIGPAILRTLSRESLPEEIDLIDGGTGGMSLLHTMKDYDRVVFIDSGDFGGIPGEIKVFTPDVAHSVKKMRRYSLHEADLMEIIRLSQRVGEAPEIIIVIIIQPKKIEMNTSLSPELAAAVHRGAKEVISQMKKIMVE